MTYYTGVRGGQRRSSQGPRTGTATTNRQLAAATRAADKADQAQALSDSLQAILNVHRAEFPRAQPRIAPAPPAIDIAAFRTKHVKEAKSATGLFSRAARKAALEEAERRAQVDATALAEQYEQEHASWQASLDKEWGALNANDPNIVLATLAEAFEDNEAAAAAIGVEGAEVTLIVVVPAPVQVPERRPTFTAAGNLSLKKLTKTEAAAMYKELVCGHALVTVKEAFAVAPALESARVIAMRATPPDAYGEIRSEVVLAARFERSELIGIQWGQADATQVVNDASTERILIQKGATQELTPVDLTKEPQLADVVGAVDFDELI